MSEKQRNELSSMLGNMLADRSFLEIDRRLRKPNMFSILRMQYRRSIYSSLLAYLLNPHENHGLEDNFLRLFLSKALASNPVGITEESEISPIPFESVEKHILDWDQLDVLSADLRETMIATDFPLGDEGRSVDICIWNEPYSFAVYVENMVTARDSWRKYHGSGVKSVKSLSSEYLLDLYRRWSTERSEIEYQILPVFLTNSGTLPGETRLTRVLDYSWMVDELIEFLNYPTISEHARMLLSDFIEHLRREHAEVLDPDFYNKINVITDIYGPAICRMHDHVAECRGCDSDDDMIVAFHDIYRRHSDTVETLWLYSDSKNFPVIKDLRKEIDSLRHDDSMRIFQNPSTISASHSSWLSLDNSLGKKSGLESFLAEVYFSASIGTCGIFIYKEPSRGMLDRIWMKAQEIAEDMDIELYPRKDTSHNFHLVKKSYEVYNSLDIARDFIRFYRMMDEIFSDILPPRPE
ncbi:PD-(D/E)XK nuclease family protein [Myxococcota bacterium]|nr:PD-(D/E)XK nuclease family protein [Myxococcota bacterium]MBU1382359.1 PD-(D/E)XK nuclease family protein [Myxococcota bacterium]MBU1498696.1 PD-(D/E)XK nuclease family protein [Myxococcota bacterium]